MKIKVCGMRDPENICQLAELPIDYMGFIFYEKSPRYISKPIDALILKKIEKKNIKKVGVFVNAELNVIKQKASENHLDIIQCHGDESPEFCRHLKQEGFSVFKAFRIDSAFNFDDLKIYDDSCDHFLFDTNTQNYGGSGKKFDWNIFQKYHHKRSFILSGGIAPGDEETINNIMSSSLHAIDLNSRFELSPAIKDVKKIEEFLRKIKSK